MRSSLAAAAAVLLAVLARALAAPVDGELRLDDRFNANHSLVNHPVMCTEQERSCLSLGLLYHESSGKCLPLGYTRKEFYSDCVYAAKPCRFNGGAGHLQAECLARAECKAAGSAVGRPLAFTGRCARPGAECACDGRPPSGLHLFGGAQCDCPPPGAAKRLRPQRRLLQPTEPGRCNVPDFSIDLHGPDAPTGGAPVRVRCPPQQSKCQGARQVWHDGACWPLLEQGPCDDNFILAFPWRHPNRFAACVRNQTCQQGRLKLAADPHNCHSEALFGGGGGGDDDGGRLRRDAHGLWRLSFRGRHPRADALLFACEEKAQARAGREKVPGQRRTRRRRGKSTQDAKGKGKGKGKRQRKATATGRPQ